MSKRLIFLLFIIIIFPIIWYSDGDLAVAHVKALKLTKQLVSIFPTFVSEENSTR